MAILEDLTDEECALYAILQDPSGVDQAEFCWVESENYDDLFRCWSFQWPWWRDMSQRQIDQCVPEGSLVLTDRGHIPIEEVQVGDKAWTHANRWQPVIRVIDQGVQEVVDIQGYGHTGLKLTENHPVLTSSGEWVGAADLTKSNRWVFPVFADQKISMPEIRRTYRSGQSNLPTVCEEFFWMCGLFVAEGSLSSTYGKGGKPNRISWSVHVDEVGGILSKLDVIGVNYNVDKPSENCRNIRVICESWASLLSDFGKGAKNKKIALWVHGLSRDSQQLVFDGATFGDGHFRRNRIEYSTISKALTYDMKMLANKLGYSTSVCYGNRAGVGMIEGRVVNISDSYVVSMQKFDTQKKPRIKFRNNSIDAPVYEVLRHGEMVQTYDLEIEEDHSFVVEGIVVHNCSRSVGKSRSIQARAFAFPFVHPGAEMVITAPESNHLVAVTDNIETALLRSRLTREMLVKGRGGIKHKPFHVGFASGARIMGRIPQRDGRRCEGFAPSLAGT